VGSDTPDKQELEAEILKRADLVVVDSLAQCKQRGEASQALRKGLLAERELIELGAVITGKAPGRSDQEQVSIADLTGVAVQDIQIAKAVYLAN
jgi:ornithine cyclodeaminase